MEGLYRVCIGSFRDAYPTNHCLFRSLVLYDDVHVAYSSIVHHGWTLFRGGVEFLLQRATRGVSFQVLIYSFIVVTFRVPFGKLPAAYFVTPKVGTAQQ